MYKQIDLIAFEKEIKHSNVYNYSELLVNYLEQLEEKFVGHKKIIGIDYYNNTHFIIFSLSQYIEMRIYLLSDDYFSFMMYERGWEFTRKYYICDQIDGLLNFINRYV